MAKVKPIPDGYHTITPYMYFNGAAKAIDFYKKALGAEEIMRHPGPGAMRQHEANARPRRRLQQAGHAHSVADRDIDGLRI